MEASMNISLQEKEVNVLRTLGEKYMKYASLPIQREKLALWKSLNHFSMQRPMVTIDQLPWHELEAANPEALKTKITDPFWESVECQLRRSIYQWENFPVDMVLEPFITIPAAIDFPSYGVDIDADAIIKTENESARAKHFNPVLNGMEDVNKIKNIEITNDTKKNDKHMQEAEFIFSGVAPVILSHGVSFNIGVWDALSTYRGVEEVYFDLIDQPEFLHALMRRITDATLAGIRSANELNVYNDISPVCHCSYVYNDTLLPDFGKGLGAVSKNSWAYGLAQLFTSVSKDVTEEFELPYATEMAKEFGAIYYGCCEKLDDRLDIIKKIPNVKKISCSPWSNRDNFAERVGKDIIISSKPNPAVFAVESFDEDFARKDIETMYSAAKANGANVEFILKDLSTINNNPLRLTRWHEIAMDVVCKGR